MVGSIPTPVSMTVRRALASWRVSRNSIRPPSVVNFIAFESKFAIACWRRRASPRTSPAVFVQLYNELELLGAELAVSRAHGECPSVAAR